MNKNKRILLLTDSLGLPRNFPEVCDYEYTWPVLLRNLGYSTHQVSIGGATTTDLLRQISYHQAFKPDIVIVQVGIVDCAPRFMTKTEQSVAIRIPFIGKKIFSFMNKPQIKKVRKITYSEPEVFVSNIKKISSCFKNSSIYFIGILPASSEYESLLPGITNNIKKYNILLEEHTNYIDISNFDLSGVMSDFHHLNENGHRQIFEKLLERLKIAI